MAFTYTDGNNNVGSSMSASTGVHGITINSGDLVVVYVHSNSTDPISADAGGTPFNEAINEQPSPKTARQGLYWKVAGASEPTSYTFTLGNAQWHVCIKVFTSDGDASVDATANADSTSVNRIYMDINAISGQIIADNALSIVAGGKDTRTGSGHKDYLTADNSFVGVIGSTQSQATTMAHRIFTTGETFVGTVRIDALDNTDTLSDSSYSSHISFVDGGAPGPGPSIAPLAMHHQRQQR